MANGNPAGAVPLYDWGNPKIISGYARETISGGELVFVSGGADPVSSGANSFVPKTDILFAQAASGSQFTGVALQTTTSGLPVSVAVDGVFLLKANGTVTAGFPVLCDGNNSVANAGSVAALFPLVGRALTTATSGGFAAVHIGRS